MTGSSEEASVTQSVSVMLMTEHRKLPFSKSFDLAHAHTHTHYADNGEKMDKK